MSRIIEIVGGFRNDAMKSVEIVFPKKDENNNFILSSDQFDLNNQNIDSYKVVPGSLIRIPKVKNDLSLGFIQLTGAVKQPGKYRILSG